MYMLVCVSNMNTHGVPTSARGPFASWEAVITWLDSRGFERLPDGSWAYSSSGDRLYIVTWLREG